MRGRRWYNFSRLNRFVAHFFTAPSWAWSRTFYRVLRSLNRCRGVISVIFVQHRGARSQLGDTWYSIFDHCCCCCCVVIVVVDTGRSKLVQFVVFRNVLFTTNCKGTGHNSQRMYTSKEHNSIADATINFATPGCSFKQILVWSIVPVTWRIEHLPLTYYILRNAAGIFFQNGCRIQHVNLLLLRRARPKDLHCQCNFCLT